jgi:hypothetical protein
MYFQNIRASRKNKNKLKILKISLNYFQNRFKYALINRGLKKAQNTKKKGSKSPLLNMRISRNKHTS